MSSLFNEDIRPSHRQSQSHMVLVAVLLLGLTLALRFAPLPENFSAFGALAIFCGLHTFGVFRWWFPLAALFLADFIGHFAGVPGMGFYHLPSMVLNYAGFAMMTLVAAGFSKWSILESPSKANALSATALVAFLASACFFLLSNFGAWLDPLMHYEASPLGLVNCYIAGLPFWRWTLASDVLFTAGFSGLASAFLTSAKRLQTADRSVHQ